MRADGKEELPEVLHRGRPVVRVLGHGRQQCTLDLRRDAWIEIAQGDQAAGLEKPLFGIGGRLAGQQDDTGWRRERRYPNERRYGRCRRHTAPRACKAAVPRPWTTVTVRLSSGCSSLTRPKSTSLTTPRGVSLMFDGLMSRWTTGGSCVCR